MVNEAKIPVFTLWKDQCNTRKILDMEFILLAVEYWPNLLNVKLASIIHINSAFFTT